jgi:uncharacterized membrane protein YkvA (DUF1232 family)
MADDKKKRIQVPPPPGNFGALERIWEQLRLAWLLFGDNRVSLLLKVLPVLAITYMISPLDMLPAILFRLLGLIDDIAVFALAIMVFNSFSPEEAVVEHLRKLRFGAQYKVSSDDEGMIIDVKAEPAEPERESAADADTESAEDMPPTEAQQARQHGKHT